MNLTKREDSTIIGIPPRPRDVINQIKINYMPEEIKKQTFSTRDLYLASTLVTLRFPLLSIDMQIEGIKPKGIGYFNFEMTAELRETLTKHNQSLLLVEPKTFISNLQGLKSSVVNMQNNPMSEFNNYATR